MEAVKLKSHRETPKAQMASMLHAEHAYRRHNLTAPVGTMPEDLENPTFWVNVANRLRPGDEVRVVDDGYQWVSVVFIAFCNGLDVRAKILYGVDLDFEGELPDEVSSNYEVKLRGTHRFCVIRKSDGEILQENIATKSAAEKWREDYLKALRQ